jgi:hypothetical protein
MHARFYAFICLSTAVGVGLDFVSIASVKALDWTAVYQWIVDSIPSRCNPGYCFRQQADAGPTKLLG